MQTCSAKQYNKRVSSLSYPEILIVTEQSHPFRGRALQESLMAIHSQSLVRFGSVSLPSSCPCKIKRLKTLTSFDSSPKRGFCRALADSSAPKARFVARRSESTTVRQLQRPLMEYMRLPASQYSVLDAERIERVDDNLFRCYVYRFKFFSFEVCPVLLVRVEEQLDGACIRLLSCKLEGSPIAVAQNEKFSASMVNKISCNTSLKNSEVQQLTSDTSIEVTIDIPLTFRFIPVALIESTGAQALEQLLRLMLPRFLMQLVKDYRGWASGDTSRQPLGTGEI